MAARRLDAEVLIAGGGPAGAAAAIVCAQRGLRAIVVEREDFRRDRPGEALHPGIEPLLRQLGIADQLAAVVGARHAGVWVEWAGQRRFEPFGADADGPWRGFQVERKRFDAMLIDRARALGVEVHQPCVLHAPAVADGVVTGAQTAAGPIACSVLIDATGSARWLARRLDLAEQAHSPPLAVRYGYAGGCCPARDEAPALVGDRRGWTWTARVRPQVYQWIRVDLDGARRARNWRPEEFAALAPIGAPRGADMTWRRVAPAAGRGWFIAGDAAAQLDPTSSHGVLKAMMSGMMAAHLAAAVIRDGAPPAQAIAEYEAWLGGWFAADVARLASFYRELGVGGFG